MTYNSLSNLSPVVRKEALTGELSRRVKAIEPLPDKDITSIVDSLVSLSLSNVLQYLDDSGKLKEQVESYKAKHPKANTPEVSVSPSPPVSEAVSQDARSIEPANGATASAPEHPSTPVSVSPSLLTPPRTSSPAGSVPPLSERDRIHAAILRLESSRQSELTDLIMSLPKRERAMCLFNNEILRAKLVDAKMVLESEDDDGSDIAGGKASDDQSTKSAPAPVPVTPQAKKIVPHLEASPSTPELSSRGPSATASPTPATPSGSSSTSHTISSLAKLPASEIIRLANSSSATGLPLPKADPIIVRATDDFIDGLRDKPVQVQKQALGEKLYASIFSYFHISCNNIFCLSRFKVVKSFNIKGAVSSFAFSFDVGAF